MSKAVVVFSGGQDSTTCLIQALRNYDEVHAITFDYGQRHSLEIEIAKGLAKKLGVSAHKIMDVRTMSELAESSLTREDIPVDHADHKSEMPNAYVPGRNILFFTLAGIYAYQVGAHAIITGVCETDFAGYPDCRHTFVRSMQETLSRGMGYEMQVQAPLMWLNKAQTWALADNLGALDMIRDETLTCYNNIIGSGCGDCPACALRRAGLSVYQNNKTAVMIELHTILKSLPAVGEVG